MIGITKCGSIQWTTVGVMMIFGVRFTTFYTIVPSWTLKCRFYLFMTRRKENIFFKY